MSRKFFIALGLIHNFYAHTWNINGLKVSKNRCLLQRVNKEKFYNERYKNHLYSKMFLDKTKIARYKKSDDTSQDLQELQKGNTQKIPEQSLNKFYYKVENQLALYNYLYDSFHEEKGSADFITLSEETISNFNLFYGSSSHPWHNLSERLKRTQTLSGDVFFDNQIIAPCINLSIINERQQALKLLLKDQHLTTKINNILEKIQKYETRLLKLFTRDMTETTVTNGIYVHDVIGQEFGILNKGIEKFKEPIKADISLNSKFKNAIAKIKYKLDQSDLALGIKIMLFLIMGSIEWHERISHNIATWNFFFNPKITDWLIKFSTYRGRKMFEPGIPKPSSEDNHFTQARYYENQAVFHQEMMCKNPKSLSEKVSSWILSPNFMFQIKQDISEIKEQYKNLYSKLRVTNSTDTLKSIAQTIFSIENYKLCQQSAFLVSGLTFHLWHQFVMPYHLAKNIKVNLVWRYLAFKKMIKDLQAASKILALSQELVDLINQYKLEKLFPNTLQNSIKMAETLKSSKLQEKLEPLFKTLKNPFNMCTKVVRCYRDLYLMQAEFLPILKGIGEIDTLSSCIHIIDENQKDKNCFSVANVCCFGKPMVELTNFWNPMLPYDIAINNDICLGSITKTNKHAIITGPNKGGKSVGMKAIFTSALLAQTLGICPASKGVISPFSMFETYKSISDDIVSNESTFSAEVSRIGEINKKINDLPKDQFALIIADELYSGTNSHDATSLAMAVCLGEIQKQQNTMWVISTHFPTIRDLEQKSNGLFKNYHVEIENDIDGKFKKFTYKLKPGITNDTSVLKVIEDAQYPEEVLAMYKGYLA